PRSRAPGCTPTFCHVCFARFSCSLPCPCHAGLGFRDTHETLRLEECCVLLISAKTQNFLREFFLDSLRGGRKRVDSKNSPKKTKRSIRSERFAHFTLSAYLLG